MLFSSSKLAGSVALTAALASASPLVSRLVPAPQSQGVYFNLIANVTNYPGTGPTVNSFVVAPQPVGTDGGYIVQLIPNAAPYNASASSFQINGTASQVKYHTATTQTSIDVRNYSILTYHHILNHSLGRCVWIGPGLTG